MSEKAWQSAQLNIYERAQSRAERISEIFQRAG
jgi:hypothetical protein